LVEDRLLPLEKPDNIEEAEWARLRLTCDSAMDEYKIVVSANLARAGGPTKHGVMREHKALQALEEARRALLSAWLNTKV
jgi:hypothetical protein